MDMLITVRVVLYERETFLIVLEWLNVPGQECVLQLYDKDLTPTHPLPPCPGKGLEHVRD